VQKLLDEAGVLVAPQRYVKTRAMLTRGEHFLTQSEHLPVVTMPVQKLLDEAGVLVAFPPHSHSSLRTHTALWKILCS